MLGTLSTTKTFPAQVDFSRSAWFTARLSARSVAEPHVTLPPPSRFANFHGQAYSQTVDIFEYLTPPLVKPLMRAYHWPIGSAVRPCIYPMR